MKGYSQAIFSVFSKKLNILVISYQKKRKIITQTQFVVQLIQLFKENKYSIILLQVLSSHIERKF
jgi:hypothetical protein